MRRISESESWGEPGWRAWERWRSEFVERGISDVYLIPGGEGEIERSAASVSWHPGGTFVPINRSSPTPILEAVAELSRALPNPSV